MKELRINMSERPSFWQRQHRSSHPCLPSSAGRRKEGARTPAPARHSTGSIEEAGAPTYPPNGLSLLLLGRCQTLRTSQNPLSAKFGEHLLRVRSNGARGPLWVKIGSTGKERE